MQDFLASGRFVVTMDILLNKLTRSKLDFD